jgi:hypothetical protein
VVAEPGQRPVQAEEGILDRVLGARLVVQQQLRGPDQREPMSLVQVPDEIVRLMNVWLGRGARGR